MQIGKGNLHRNTSKYDTQTDPDNGTTEKSNDLLTASA